MTSPKKVVTLHEGVADVLKEMANEVSRQLATLDTVPTTYEELATRQRDYIVMANSLLFRVLDKLVGSDYDGDLHLTLPLSGPRPLSLGFTYSSGSHGDVLFWPASKQPTEPGARHVSPFGQWSVAT